MSCNYTSNLYKLSLILKDIEEGHLLIENFVNIYMAKRMVLQCINGVGSNPVEGRTKI